MIRDVAQNGRDRDGSRDLIMHSPKWSIFNKENKLAIASKLLKKHKHSPFLGLARMTFDFSPSRLLECKWWSLDDSNCVISGAKINQ